jgi:hypothetical protein
MARHNLWPTPNVPNGGRTTWHAEQEGNSFYHNGKKVQLVLEQAVRMATPLARDARTFKGNVSPPHHQGGQNLGQQIGGTLNPTWVEWLMGWPIGWTALEPLAMDGYQQWLSKHGGY